MSENRKQSVSGVWTTAATAPVDGRRGAGNAASFESIVNAGGHLGNQQTGGAPSQPSGGQAGQAQTQPAANATPSSTSGGGK